MRFIQKAFAALCLTVASLSSQAFDLPVHHQYVMYSVDYRDYAINGSGHSVIISYPTGQLLKGDPAGGFTNLGSLEYWLHQSNCRK